MRARVLAAAKGGAGPALRFLVKKRQHFGRRGGESIANPSVQAGCWIAIVRLFQRFPP